MGHPQIGVVPEVEYSAFVFPLKPTAGLNWATRQLAEGLQFCQQNMPMRLMKLNARFGKRGSVHANCPNCVGRWLRLKVWIQMEESSVLSKRTQRNVF